MSSDSQGVQIEYPNRYTFKVMGRHQDDFSAHVRTLFARLMAQDLEEGCFEDHVSRNAHYLSVSVTVLLTSESQRRDIYQGLHEDPRVVYYL